MIVEAESGHLQAGELTASKEEKPMHKAKDPRSHQRAAGAGPRFQRPVVLRTWNQVSKGSSSRKYPFQKGETERQREFPSSSFHSI
jgi:hypothetical protein